MSDNKFASDDTEDGFTICILLTTSRGDDQDAITHGDLYAAARELYWNYLAAAYEAGGMDALGVAVNRMSHEVVDMVRQLHEDKEMPSKGSH